MIAYPVKKNDCATISQDSRWTIRFVFVLDLVPDGSIPIGRTEQIDWGHAHALSTYLFLVLKVCRQFTKRPILGLYAQTSVILLTE